eukprot:SM000227S07446  [mRNA]  locus=s227:132124:133038:+ [translate_table: standard]
MDEGAALPGELLDLVDDEWRADVLPDDGRGLCCRLSAADAKSTTEAFPSMASLQEYLGDIPLPPGTEAPADDIEDPGQEHQAAGTDTWPDIGLHTIM